MSGYRRAAVALPFALTVLLCGCRQSTTTDDGATSQQVKVNTPIEQGGTMQITTTAFDANQRIPREYTGEGPDKSPALSWSGVPAGTAELALIMDDPDAPRPEPWVHWVLYKIPRETTGLPEGVPREKQLGTPAGALQGANSWPGDNIGYRGPMPPPRHGTHNYHFKLYALDQKLDVQPGLTKEKLLAAMKGHILAEAEVVGTYSR